MDLYAASTELGTHRKRRTRGSACRMRVISDIGPNEPVSDAEIRLVLAFLGDKIAQILDPANVPCPPPAMPPVE